MAASTTDKFRKVAASTVTTLSAPGKALAATSINVGSTTNYPTDTGITIAIRQVDSDGELVAGTYTEWVATVSSATSFAIDATPVYGTDQVYAAGSTTQVYMPASADNYNDLVDGILAHANQDGTLKDGAVDDAAVLASNVVTTAKINDSAVTTAKIADSNVTTAKYADTSVTSTKIDWSTRQRGFTTFPTGTTTSTSSTNASNTGGATPSFSVTVPVTGYYEVGIMRNLIWNSGANDTRVHYAVSGATTVAARELIQHNGTSGTRLSNFDIVQLTAGSNTISFYCSVGGGTGNFSGGMAYYRQV